MATIVPYPLHGENRTMHNILTCLSLTSDRIIHWYLLTYVFDRV